MYYLHSVLLTIFCLTNSYGKCILKCQIPFTVEPKCGSNGVTYQNIEELFCAKRLCDSDLVLSHNGSCDGKYKDERVQLKPGTDKSLLPTPTNELQNTRKSSPSRGLGLIIKKRPVMVTSAATGQLISGINCDFDQCTCDYTLYPVCGSNGVTYGNPCILECAQGCDPNIELHHSGFCGKIFFSPSVNQLKFFRLLTPTGGDGISLKNIKLNSLV